MNNDNLKRLSFGLAGIAGAMAYTVIQHRPDAVSMPSADQWAQVLVPAIGALVSWFMAQHKTPSTAIEVPDTLAAILRFVKSGTVYVDIGADLLEVSVKPVPKPTEPKP